VQPVARLRALAGGVTASHIVATIASSGGEPALSGCRRTLPATHAKKTCLIVAPGVLLTSPTSASGNISQENRRLRDALINASISYRQR
jgi:hypothetical protein